MDVSKRIIALRERCGLTQNGLAERAGVSQTHLRRVELGQADITIGHLQLLCDAMGISLQDFLRLIPRQTKCLARFPSFLQSKRSFLRHFLKAYKPTIRFFIKKWTHHFAKRENDVSNFLLFNFVGVIHE